MEFESRQRTTPNISLAALVDVVFILVIFIVLGANFHRIQTLEVSVPVTESPDESEAEPESLVIVIPVTGFVDVQGTKVELENVRELLQSMMPRYDSVLLVADQAASVQRAVGILSDAQAAGFTSVAIAIRKPDEHVP